MEDLERIKKMEDLERIKKIRERQITAKANIKLIIETLMLEGRISTGTTNKILNSLCQIEDDPYSLLQSVANIQLEVFINKEKYKFHSTLEKI